jgi:Cytochrome P450
MVRGFPDQRLIYDWSIEQPYFSPADSFNFPSRLPMLSWILLVLVLSAIIYKHLASPLCRIPGPLVYALTKWRLALDDLRANRTREINSLHTQYGPVVRVGPSELSFSSLSALRIIYGAGSGFERTDFYRMFDVYGRPNLFTFAAVEDHSRRKKMLHHAYSKSVILNSTKTSKSIHARVQQALKMIDASPTGEVEVYAITLFYSLDNITHFLYGEIGATSALRGNKDHQQMLNDQRDPRRRRMAWFGTHVKWYVRWLSRQSGVTERFLDAAGFFPQRKPFVYTGIRQHALRAYYDVRDSGVVDEETIIGRLQRFDELDDLDIASECADHFLAGINTTADTLLFAFWTLSRPENAQIQQRLIEELQSAKFTEWVPPPKALNSADTPYFDAILLEILRLYAPLPASEPRVHSTDIEIGGYLVPAGTVVSCQPYTLHRNPDVFPEPETFLPERWLGNNPELNRWWWAFSSGGRMCIGEQYFSASYI